MTNFVSILSSLNRKYSRGTVSRLTVIISTAMSILVIGIGYWIFSPSAEDLLDSDTLTPKQIRAIATKLLIHKDVAIRSKASNKLVSVGQAAIPVLKDIGMTHSDPQIRLAVLEILKLLDAEEAVEIVEDMYNDPDPEVRLLALDGAWQINHPRAVAVLSKAMDDPDESIRSTTAGRLGSMNDKSVIPRLKEALNDPSPRIRRHAARSLENLTGADYSNQIKR